MFAEAYLESLTSHTYSKIWSYAHKDHSKRAWKRARDGVRDSGRLLGGKFFNQY